MTIITDRMSFTVCLLYYVTVRPSTSAAEIDLLLQSQWERRSFSTQLCINFIHQESLKGKAPVYMGSTHLLNGPKDLSVYHILHGCLPVGNKRNFQPFTYRSIYIYNKDNMVP